MKRIHRFAMVAMAVAGLSCFSDRLAAAELLAVDFSTGEDGFTTASTGSTTEGPWIYNSDPGTWSADGAETGTPTSHSLISPVITVPGEGDTPVSLRLHFDHRYSVEPEWDGMAVQVGANGGEFEVVDNEAFLENGYTFFGLIGNHVLSGGDGFNGDSQGYAGGDFITSTANLGVFNPGDEVQVAFLGAWDEGARGSLPNWEIDGVTVETLDDTDGDGMYDEYEEANGLDSSMDDAAGDLDTDTVTNLDEFLNGTDPQDDDSDDDGLSDGVETKTGVFVSADDTGTDPLLADTDGDGLADGVESGTGTFVSADDTGTNPNNVDTDDDGIADGAEVTFEANPVDPLDLPEGWVVRNATSSSGLNSIANTRALFGGSGVLDETLTLETVINFRDNATGVFDNDANFPVLGAQDLDVEDFAILAQGTIFVDAAGSYTFGFNSDDGGGLWIDGEPVVIVDANRGSATSLGATELSFGNHKVEFLYWERGGGAQVELFAHNEVGNFEAEAFDVADYHLLETSFLVSDDTDGDGLPDEWETDFFGDLSETADGDPDSDGSTNANELAVGTDPTDEDSDDDTVLDGAETDTGVFVSAEDTGSDPLNTDTDGDGLSDGVETGTGVFVSAEDTGSNPVDEDTDDDAVEDGREVSEGFDPNDPESKPDLPAIEVVGTGTTSLLGMDLTDPEDDGDEAAGPEDSSWNWVSIESNDEPGFEGGEFSYNVFDNTLGPGNAKWCCNGASEESPLQLTVEFDLPHLITHFTVSSANDVPTRDPLDWQILGSNDGENFTPIFTQSDDTPLWTERLQVLRFNLPAPSPPYKFIRYEVTRTGDANHQIGEIEYFGFPGGDDPNLVALSSWNLGELPSDMPSESTLALRNTGLENALTLTDVQITGADAANFSVVSFPDELGAFGSGTETGELVIAFDPAGGLGGFSAVIEIQSNDETDTTVSIPVSALVPNPVGPVAHYRLDESAGATVIVDASGYARNGTVVGDVTFGAAGLTAATATAAEFAGGAFGSVDGELFDVFDSYSVSLWMQAADLTSAEPRVLVAKGNDTVATFGLLQLGDALGWLVDAEPAHMSDAGVLTADAPLHVVAVLDNTAGAASLAFYVDGAEVFRQEDPTTVADSMQTVLSIGAFNNGALGFDGTLDDVQIYPRVLTADEVVFLRDNPGQVITPTPPVGDVDSDGDGVTDDDEAIAGTDPNDASDYFRVTAVIPADGSNTIQWPAVAGKTYAVEYSLSMEDGTWAEVATGLTTGEWVETDAGRLAEPVGFYRVRVE